MKKILNWFDNNFLVILAGFLLIFIPLYPKWPLFDVLPGYNVRVRLEDFFVLFSAFVFALQLIRRKIQFAFTPIVIGLLSYLFIGFVSSLVAIFVIQTVPLQAEFVEKTFLHWARRIEYFSLFFIVFGAVKSIKNIKFITFITFITFIGVIFYGYGQKYLYWPAFSTMNREFAKGWWLYLSEHARVLSTFGGHYDLAGYLVIALSLCWSFFFGAKKWWSKILVAIPLSGGFWLLILTASRISFISYMVGLSIVVLLWTFKKGIGWGISRWVTAVFLSMLIMLSFGDLSDRFLHLVRLDQRLGNLRQMLLKPIGNLPQNKAMFLENNLAAVTSRSDMPPLPKDVTNNTPLMIAQKTASGATIFVETPRTYSQNALLYDLSTAIRLDATWPRAIAGFKTNPLTGSGYATLTQTSKYEFTEGESTDSDYLRALGETGLLGFSAFFGTLGIMALLGFKSLGGIKDPFLYSLTVGFIGAVIGLLANASYIDIFEASKVAYVFWGVAGLTMGSLYLLREKIKKDYEPLKLIIPWREFLTKIAKFLKSDFFLLGLVIILAVTLRFYKIDSPVADWHSWRQADTSAVTRNFIKNDKIDLFYPTYDDLSSVASGLPNPKGLRFVEFPLYNAASVLMRVLFPEFSLEGAGRATTASASIMTLVFIFLICRKILSRRIAYLATLVYTLLPYSIFYGRVILPDPSMVAMGMGANWFALKYTETPQKRFLIFSLIFAIAALLIKPFAIFLLVPISYIQILNIKSKKSWLLAIGYWLLAIAPLALWRLWISQFPEGVPASSWLLNGDGIRFKGAFWYWLFADRIGRLILGYWGLILLGFGLVRKIEGKYRFFSIIFLLSAICYLLIFATGNVRHDYYQILIIPSLAILIGLGIDYLLSFSLRGILLSVVCCLFAVSFGWYFVRDYYNINHPEIVEAGKIVDKIAAPGALVVAPYSGDTAFLYQTNRSGWPIMEGTIDEMAKRGADFYVSNAPNGALEQEILANSETPDYIKSHIKDQRKKYILHAYTDQYVIFEIRK